jgi:SAM-dependent methyltransferase
MSPKTDLADEQRREEISVMSSSSTINRIEENLQSVSKSSFQFQDYVLKHFDRLGMRPHLLGRCNICGGISAFFSQNENYRESLVCVVCKTISRYRSIARGILLAISELRGIQAHSIVEINRIIEDTPLKIYDTQVPFCYENSSYPIPYLLSKCKGIDVQTSTYMPQKPWGVELGTNITNQNLEQLTFLDNSFDIVITGDVMEHVRLDARAHREIRRVLKPGGIYLFTVPHFRHQSESMIRVVVTDPLDPSKDEFVMEKEYHGDAKPGRPLSYRAYGTDLDKYLVSLGFTVAYSKQNFPNMGIMNTELFFCRLSK